MTTLEAFFWTGVTLCVLWIIAGVIALILGLVFLEKNEDYPMTLGNALIIILLGGIALMEICNDIKEETDYLSHH